MEIPSLSTLGLSILLLWSLYFCGRIAYNVFFHPLAKFPGPILLAASWIPYSAIAVTGNLPYTIRRLHEKYGDTVRIAPDSLSYSSAEALTDIYCNTPSRPCMPKDPITYQVSPQDVHSILTVPAAEDHSRYRRVLNYAFSARSLSQQESLILGYVQTFISRLHEQSQAGPVDLFAWYSFTISDIIGDLCFGEPFGCLESGETHPWVSLLFSSFRFTTYLSLLRRFPIILKLLIALIPTKTAQEAANHDNVTREKIRRRMLKEDDRNDFMHAVLENNKDKGKMKGMSTAEISSTFHLVLVAGLETTASAVTALTYLLLRNPRTMERTVHEIMQAFNEEGDITATKCIKLPYLMGVVNEGLRMIPATPWGAPRVVPGKGSIIDGSWVPGGTTVNVCFYASYNLSTNFHHPNSFAPERWLPHDHEYYNADFKDDNHRAFHPFSLGPRNCIGKNLAYAEITLIVARLLWNFELSLDDRSTEWSKDMKAYITWDKGPLYVNLIPRVGRGQTDTS